MGNSIYISINSIRKRYNIKFQMNRFAYNPNVKVIEQWKQLLFDQSIIDSFESIIDNTHMYLEIIHQYKNKKQSSGLNDITSRHSLCSGNSEKEIALSIRDFNKNTPGIYRRKIEEWMERINDLKEKLSEDHQEAVRYSSSEGKSKEEQKDQIEDEDEQGRSSNKGNNSKFDICQTHLQQITIESIKFYHDFLHQEFQVVEEFVKLKMNQLKEKFKKMSCFLETLGTTHLAQIRVIYENLFIETDYLCRLIQETQNIFRSHSHQKEYSSEYAEINEVRGKYMGQLQALSEEVQAIKEDLHAVYFAHFKKKKSRRIKDHQKLEKLIVSQIAVNSKEYEQNTKATTFINGFTFAFLLCALIAIIIFREVNIQALQSDPNYLRDFRIWRGASYLIYFNWILVIMLMLFQKYRINYRMILIEDDIFMPKYETFFLTASILSAVYLILFLVYLLYKLQIITGHESIQNLGFYMCIINIVFLLNPFKILNYEGRRYYLTMLGKFMISFFRPMNMNIYAFATTIGSFVQPFSDFSYTVCQAVYSQTRDCMIESKNATFIFTMIYLFFRFVQSVKSQIQTSEKGYNRALMSITVIIFTANTVVSSYLYNIHLTKELQIYWLVSAALSTIASIQGDLRANWGFISFDEEDCLLRKFKVFPRAVYFIASGLDMLLNVGWVLTISNNLAANMGINMVYFLMILSYIELARKGLVLFFRLEDDHCANISNLKAVLDDSSYYRELEAIAATQINPKITVNPDLVFQEVDLTKSKDNRSQTQCRSNTVSGSIKHLQSEQIFDLEAKLQSVNPLQNIQKMVDTKKSNKTSLEELIKDLKDYLGTIHSIYLQLEWQDEY